MGLSLSVIVVTLDRPECVRRCLEHLRAQTRRVEQVIVVDGSAERTSLPVVEAFEGTEYVFNPNGFGRMTGSRNLGLLRATGDIVAYLDDDAYAEPTWAEELVSAYASADVAAVGGRALNAGQADNSTSPEDLGRVRRDGQVTGGFAADTGGVIEVDHLIGCNMSFRRSVLIELGGFHEFYPGFCCTYEEADLCMRIKRLGYRILFAPAALVDHVPAPRRVGKRFDARYVFGTTRNHCTLLMRNWGPGRPAVWLYPLRTALKMTRVILDRLVREVGKLILKLGAVWIGALTGVLGGLWQRWRIGDDLVRRDEVGAQIRASGATSKDVDGAVGASEFAAIEDRPAADHHASPSAATLS